jgi:hypothetical protein
MNKKLLNRIALSLALLIPASYLNAVCPCKFKNNTAQVPVGYKAPQSETTPSKSVIMTEEVAQQDPFASCETGSCPIIWDTEEVEELEISFDKADLEELTKEDAKNVKSNSSMAKKVAVAAGTTTAVVAGVAYYLTNLNFFEGVSNNF